MVVKIKELIEWPPPTVWGGTSKTGLKDTVGATSWVREPKKRILILLVINKPNRVMCGTAFTLPVRLAFKAFAAITPGMSLGAVGELDIE
jgi:hypothetical protein